MVPSSTQPASRYRRRILGMGVLLVGALYVIGAPMYVDRIESDLDSRVPAELAAAGYDGITATFSGQDGTLTCIAPLDDPERARGAAYEIWGVRAIELDRSCRVNTAASPSTAPSTPDPEPSDESSAGGQTESTPASSTTTPSDSDLATVYDIVAANPDLAFMAVLLADADLGRTEGPVTLFAPSNDAFDAMPADVLRQLQNDSELLERSLAHHAVEGSIRSTDLVDGELIALDGTSLTVVVGDEISVGGATIVDADIVASNGIVHVIDSVIAAPEAVQVVARSAATFDGERVVLTGVVAGEPARQLLVAAAVDAVGDEAVLDETTIDADSGLGADRAETLATLIRAMPAGLASAEAGFDGADFYAEGVAVSEAGAAAFRTVASAVGVDAEVTAPPDATEADADDLEERLNAFVDENPILFEPSSAVLDASAVGVIDELARLAAEFTGIAITVAGHTDSDGPSGENLQLSESRAEAVQAALLERGLVDVDAVGFGSEQPVLVGGIEDKAASRRVEFQVVTTS